MKNTPSVPGWLLAAAIGLPLLVLGSPLIEIDDARYAEVPRAMATSGDWIVPSLNAMPYVEKPPLWYWLAAASIGTFGTSEAAARLPMFLLALLEREDRVDDGLDLAVFDEFPSLAHFSEAAHPRAHDAQLAAEYVAHIELDRGA